MKMIKGKKNHQIGAVYKWNVPEEEREGHGLSMTAISGKISLPIDVGCVNQNKAEYLMFFGSHWNRSIVPLLHEWMDNLVLLPCHFNRPLTVPALCPS